MTSRLKRFARRLALLSGSVLLTCLLLECGVRLFVDLDRWSPIRVTGVNPDDRLTFDVSYDEPWTHPDYTHRVKINPLGRRDDPWSAEAIADPNNILFIGDSFVWGIGVHHDATIPTHLENAGCAAEVFNFGQPDAGPIDYRALHDRARAAGLTARRVVLGVFIGNDFNGRNITHSEATPSREPPPAFESHLWKLIKIRVSSSTRLVGWLLTSSRWLGARVYTSSSAWIYQRHQSPEQQATFRRHLDEIGAVAKATDDAGASIVIVVIPNRIQVENAAELTSDVFDATKPNALIADYCKQHGLTCVDLLPPLVAENNRAPQTLFHRIDRHFTPAGTKVAAEAIAAAMCQ